MNKEALLTQLSFHFSPTSAHILPLQNIQQRLRGIWESLTWPVVRRILKADLAVTVAFALLLIEPIRQQVDYGIVLAQIATEFVHPAKSYGSLGEDIAFGTVMCTVATGWSLLGTYCAYLVRDQDNAEMAQPKVAGVLVSFLLVGAFCLNYLRARVDQANLGGMLSATILVISLTSAVRNHNWQPRTVLQDFVPVMVGFGIVFVICIVVWPENSTRIFVQQLAKTLDEFDGIARRQVDGFLHINAAPRDHCIYPSKAQSTPPESMPVVHRVLENHLTNLVKAKRVVRREASFNAIAPRDVSDMTKLLKKMRVPLQGISLSRAMEENMRKAQTRRHIAIKLKRFAARDSLDPIKKPVEANASRRTSYSGDSFTTMGSNIRERESEDEAPCWSDDEEDAGQPASGNSSSISRRPSTSMHQKMISNACENTRRISAEAVPRLSDSGAMVESSVGGGFGTPDTHITIDVPKDDLASSVHAWRREYDDILKMVRPIYRELSQACSTAVQESIRRLYHLQRIDPRFVNKPWLYRILCRDRLGPPSPEYAKDFDPSGPLLRAIHRFDAHRLRGLERLYQTSDDAAAGPARPVPRRILFLLLHFQFNLRCYAERIYTLSSLIYEMDQARNKRRVWWPHISIRKWLNKRPEVDVGLDPPATVVETQYQSGLQRTLSRRTTTILNNMAAEDDLEEEREKEETAFLTVPPRGQLWSQSSAPQRRRQSSEYNVAAVYHDPDVAYPTTRIQFLFYTCWRFWRKYLYSADTVFALRACVIVMALTLPAFVEDSIEWYTRARGQWAAVVGLVWMGPSVGSNFFGLMVRTVGTFIGAVCALLIWELSRANRAGLIVLFFIFNLPWWLVYLNGKFWKATGLFSLITTSIIIGYGYNYMKDGTDISIYEVTYERTIAVLVGVIAALIISVFPYPSTGRVELRHRIARTLGDLAALYSSFLALLLKNGRRDEDIRLSNRKVFRTVAAAIRKQIKGERVLLEQSRFEPALRGVFQEDKYVQILQVLENMVNLMIDMEHALERIPERWRVDLVKATWKERKTTIASFLTALHLGANALSNKAPLPPYVFRPTRARRNLTNKARLIPNLQPERLADPEYTYYSAYLMSSEQLAVEIELLISTIRELVGPDSVSVWLDYRH